MAAVVHFDPADPISGLGPALVVAPHPDDESIGCGGLIALMRERGLTVGVLLLSDGAMSHPNSRRFPAQARRDLRWAELGDALDALGVPRGDLHAMGWPDGGLPHGAQDGFGSAVREMTQFLQERAARTLLVPWRRDPHADHRAASEIARCANARLARPARVLEYCVWTAERGLDGDRPQEAEASSWSVDISRVVPRKMRAIAAHRSQCGGVIDDDALGFTLSTAMLARSAEPVETFYEWRGEDDLVEAEWRADRAVRMGP